MSTDFSTAPLASGHKGAGGGAVEKSPNASHTKNLTVPRTLTTSIPRRPLTSFSGKLPKERPQKFSSGRGNYKLLCLRNDHLPQIESKKMGDEYLRKASPIPILAIDFPPSPPTVCGGGK